MNWEVVSLKGWDGVGGGGVGYRAQSLNLSLGALLLPDVNF